MGWEGTESSSHSTRCHGQEHLPLERVVRGTCSSFGMGWRLKERTAGAMAGAAGSAAYNSQKPLRESPAPAANESPRCRAIKCDRGGASASFDYGGESGRWCGNHREPSVAILRRWGSPAASASCGHRARRPRFGAFRRLRRAARPCPRPPPQAGPGPG